MLTTIVKTHKMKINRETLQQIHTNKILERADTENYRVDLELSTRKMSA